MGYSPWGRKEQTRVSDFASRLQICSTLPHATLKLRRSVFELLVGVCPGMSDCVHQECQKRSSWQ